MKEKTPLLNEFVCFQIGIKDFWLEVFYYLSENYLFLKIYVTSKGVVSHNVLYYQQLSITCYQVSFYDNICFE